MRVIIVHQPEGDAIAVLADTAIIGDMKFTEINKEDDAGLISNNPALQKELQTILQDVMAMFGFHVAVATKHEMEEHRQKQALAEAPAAGGIQ